MNRRHRALVLVLVLGLLVVGLTGRALTVADRGDRVKVGGNGPMQFTAPPGPMKPTDRGSFTAAEARAYALLGQFDDGVIDRLPSVDGETQVAIERMRPLLDRQQLRRGEHRPTVTPNGTFTIAAPARRRGHSTVAHQSVDGELTSSAPTRTDGAASATSATRLDLVEPQGTVALNADGHVISGRNVWAAIHAEPGRGLPVHIADRGEGGHVVALFGDDVGSLRLNGGLVVPGRYYRIQGSVEITGSAPVNVHIRPLSAVPDYHEGPLQAPSANG